MDVTDKPSLSALRGRFEFPMGRMVCELHLEYFRLPGMPLLTRASHVPPNTQVCLFVFV